MGEGHYTRGAPHCHHEPPPPSPPSTDTAFLCVSSELFSTKSSFKQVSIIQCVLVLTVSVCAHLNLFVSTKNPTVTTLSQIHKFEDIFEAQNVGLVSGLQLGDG